MTLIIIQVMRSSLYTTVDENLKTLSKDPYSLAAIAYRDQRQSKDKDNDEDPEVMIPDHDKIRTQRRCHIQYHCCIAQQKL